MPIVGRWPVSPVICPWPKPMKSRPRSGKVKSSPGPTPVGPARESAPWRTIQRPNHRRRSSIDEPVPSAWLAPVTAVLDRLGARWALIGALAALEYRQEPRLTTDLDLLVESVDGLAEAFRAAGFDVRAIADPGEPVHLLLVRGHGIKADLLLVDVEYQQVALDRSTQGVITAEDVIVHKLIAWRARDQDDVLSILRSGRSLDEEYIEYWAGEWDVSERWDEARRSR